ncbi:hypothetical protein EDD11_005151 [Mortierella claussenii]|nr:hypothetical protein EDD11_005151 [Mortierella claussenii]
MDFAVQCQHLTRLVLVSSRYLTPTNGLELLTSNVWDTYFARIIENNQRTLQAVDMYLEDFDEPPGIPFWETLAGCDSLRTLVCEDLDLLSTSSNLYHLQSQDNATDNPWHPVHGQSWRAVRRILNRVETLSLQDSRFPTRPEWWQPLVDEGQHQGDQFHDQEHNRVQQPAKSLVFSRLKEVWIHGGHLTGLELLLQCVATSVTMPVCDDVSGREEDGKEFAFCQLQHLTWSCISGRLEEDYPKVEHFLQVFSQTNMRIQLLQAQCPSSEVFWRVRSLLEESNDVGTSDTSKLRKGVKLRDVNLNSILTRLRETPMRSIELGQAA